MQTEVIMQRELFGMTIAQKSKSEFFSATDLVRAGNKWRMSNGLSAFDLTAYFRQKGTQEFITELEQKFGKVKISGNGRGNHSWVHPFLFIDIALAISPKLKIETYEWLFDNLIRYRNDSGDSYKKMCGALFANSKNKSTFHLNIPKLADFIKVECAVKDWQTATEEQLRHRDRIHENIALLSDVLQDNDKAIEYGILKARTNNG